MPFVARGLRIVYGADTLGAGETDPLVTAQRLESKSVVPRSIASATRVESRLDTHIVILENLILLQGFAQIQ